MKVLHRLLLLFADMAATWEMENVRHMISANVNLNIMEKTVLKSVIVIMENVSMVKAGTVRVRATPVTPGKHVV